MTFQDSAPLNYLFTFTIFSLFYSNYFCIFWVIILSITHACTYLHPANDFNMLKFINYFKSCMMYTLYLLKNFSTCCHLLKFMKSSFSFDICNLFLCMVWSRYLALSSKNNKVYQHHKLNLFPIDYMLLVFLGLFFFFH